MDLSSEPRPQRVLIVRLGAIGDVVNALTVAAALKDRDPGVHVGWLVHPLARPLVEGNPAVDRVHVLPRKGMFAALRGLRKELRGESYDLVIDLQRMLKSAVLARMAGAPRVLGYDRSRCKEGAWMLYKERIPKGPKRAHMVEQYAEFARYLGCAGPVRHPLPPIPPEVDARAKQWLAPLGDQAPIAIHIGASKPENRWIPERYGDLIGTWRKQSSRGIVLTGGPGDRVDAALALQRWEGQPGFVDLVGRTDLHELMAVLSHCRAFVGCDTGPMHLAVALGQPVVALFGPADPLRTGPFGEVHRVVRQPPALVGAPLPPAEMKDVSVRDAANALKKIAEEGDDPR
ncbi:MAG: glycosyltransferase family 9 protein [Planctomycetes bacterium]|nr:glycosyltransferase family 9 protein [Planctomycetota bacterium]